MQKATPLDSQPFALKMTTMKKPIYFVGLAAVAAIAVLPFSGTPLLAKAIDAGTNLAEAVLNKPQVTLQLTVDQQHVQKDAQGKDQISWIALSGSKVIVKPGDVLRYTLIGNNKGTRPAQNVTMTQPIPNGTVYVLRSATASNQGANVTYSIDRGANFVAKPMVKVTLPSGQIEERPAPAEAYTHVRWRWDAALAPKAAVQMSYQVKVRQ